MSSTRTNTSALLDLPKEIREEIYSRSPLSALSLLAQTSKEYESDTAFSRLLSSAVDAQPESYQQADQTKLAAMTILEKHPEWLFKEAKPIKDHFQRTIAASPYRLFLGAGDVWALKKIHETIIPLIKDGEEKAKEQFLTQFPNYVGPWPLDPQTPEEALYDERNKEQIQKVKAELKIIVEKLSDPWTFYSTDTNEAEDLELIGELQKIFSSKEGETIKTGLHFPLGIFKEIAKAYEDFTYNYQLMSLQLPLFSCKVIGTAQAALTAVDGQFFKHGLKQLNEKNGPNRTDGLFCPHPKKIPQKKAPLTNKLGYSMFVDPNDGSICSISCFHNVYTSYPDYSWYPEKFFGRLFAYIPKQQVITTIEKLMEIKSIELSNVYASEYRCTNTSTLN